MGLNLASFTGNNIGSANTGQNYGPFNIGSAARIVHVILSMTISFPGSTLADTASLVTGIMWGVQWGAAGYTPGNLPGDAFRPEFLFAEYAADNIGASVAWTPAANTGAVLSGYTARREWRAQLPVFSSSVDVYVSTGTTITQPAWEASWHMRWWNTT